jgi:hypothetical protein
MDQGDDRLGNNLGDDGQSYDQGGDDPGGDNSGIDDEGSDSSE